MPKCEIGLYQYSCLTSLDHFFPSDAISIVLIVCYLLFAYLTTTNWSRTYSVEWYIKWATNNELETTWEQAVVAHFKVRATITMFLWEDWEKTVTNLGEDIKFLPETWTRYFRNMKDECYPYNYDEWLLPYHHCNHHKCPPLLRLFISSYFLLYVVTYIGERNMKTKKSSWEFDGFTRFQHHRIQKYIYF